ncbi:MAG: four helix bundle protein [candidate division KSB1 bacterium]|nr:four helix bundle protein [candidate division KSB1 bacterium]
MAQYEHLPIYKKAYDLTLYFEQIVRNFSRYNKYTFGTELRQLSREVLRLIRRANDSADKAPILLQNRERLEDLKMTIRMCKDLKVFPNFNSYQYSINEVVDLCRQNEGWLKMALQKSGRPESAPHLHGAGSERANR